MRVAWTSTSKRALAVGAAVVGLSASLLLVPVLELWRIDLGVPLASVYEAPNGYAYARDAPFYLMLAKGGIDHAWFLTNPTLGWPLGQQLYDLPQSLDNLNLFGLKVLGLVFGDVGTTVNVFFLLTFAAVAISAYLVLRAIRVSTPTAFVVALLYTFLPYHFARGMPHLFLSAYWIVPLAVYLMLRVVSDRPPFTVDRDTTRGFALRFFDRSGWLWLLACVAIASSGAYYGVFTALLLAALAGIDYAANRRARVVASGACALAVIIVVAVVNLAPTFVYRAEHGSNDALLRRLPYETEYEGLKVSQLLLPIEHHRLEPFADVQSDSARFTPVPSEKGQHLGLIGALGFLVLLAALLLAARRRRRRSTDIDRDRDRDDDLDTAAGDTLRTLGILTVVAILLATVSGFSLLISGAGFRDIRSWNRIVVFVAFFSLIAVAFGLDWIGRRLPDRRWRTPVSVAALVLVLVLGILDQVSPASIPDYDATQKRWDSDAEFVSEIEGALPAGAAVFQLPYRYFPEAQQVAFLGPYDLVRGYLHSHDLEWSWGGVRGRGADWQMNAVRRPVDDFLDRITAVGFRGLLLDRATFYDGGGPGEQQINAALGTKPVKSNDGELVFWGLRDRARELRARYGVRGVAELRRETLADVPKVRAQGS